MSAVNLESFALSKGIEKNWKDMSQSEQTMLRYQYLMKATADAQGDFARTSDGYANSMRRVQTALTSIKSSVGTVMLPMIEEWTTGLAGFLEKLTTPKDQTVLDEFASIKLDTEKKLADIQKVATEAGALLGVLNRISSSTDASKAMENLANGANILKASSPFVWSSLLTALQKVDGLQNIFSDSSAGQNVTNLAQALSGNSPDTSKAEAWQTFLDALGTNTGALSALTGKSAQGTAEWLKTMATAANEIEPEDADAWNKLLSSFVGDLPGLKDTEGGKAFFEAMAANFLAMGTESEEAKNGLLALGMSTEDIDTAQKQWLETCKRLVQTIPGLSSIINTQTGEVKGGTEAVKTYVETWQREQQKLLLWEAQYAKESALIERKKKEASLQLDVWTAQERVKSLREQYEALGGQDAFDKNVGTNIFGNRYGKNDQGQKILNIYDSLIEAQRQLVDTTIAYGKEVEANRPAEEQVAASRQALEKMTGKLADETEAAAESMSLLQQAANGTDGAMEKVKGALDKTLDAFTKLNDYQEKVRQETAQSVSQVIKGFESMGEKAASGLWAWNTPAEEAARKMKDLTAQMNELDTSTAEGQKQWAALNDQINQMGGQKASVQNMTQALESQLAYIREYKAMLDEARTMGVSEEILATLSDGSQQSFDYLKALTTTGGDITGVGGLNDLYRQVQEESSAFVDTLTEQKLTADNAYKGILQTAQEAISGLNLGDEAYSSVAATVQGIVNALGDKASEVETQVNNILAQIARLQTAGGYGAQFGFGGLHFSGRGSIKEMTLTSDGSQANGLEYVPYDGYLAMLHQGERIQTAAEADLSRRYSNQQPQFDYSAMGSAMWDSAPNLGGNVYLDGQTVGRIISGRQADSFRALERSGWKG